MLRRLAGLILLVGFLWPIDWLLRAGMDPTIHPYADIPGMGLLDIIGLPLVLVIGFCLLMGGMMLCGMILSVAGSLIMGKPWYWWWSGEIG